MSGDPIKLRDFLISKGGITEGITLEQIKAKFDQEGELEKFHEKHKDNLGIELDAFKAIYNSPAEQPTPAAEDPAAAMTEFLVEKGAISDQVPVEKVKAKFEQEGALDAFYDKHGDKLGVNKEEFVSMYQKKKIPQFLHKLDQKFPNLVPSLQTTYQRLQSQIENFKIFLNTIN